MKIAVVIKQVPDTETRIKLGSDSNGANSAKSLDQSSVKWIVNPYDEHAIEEALQLRDKNPGSSTFVLSVGPSRCFEALRTALAMGIDEAIHIEAKDSLDSLQTAQAIAQVLKSQGEIDLVLLGQITIDDGSTEIGPQVAEILGWGCVSSIGKLQLAGSEGTAQREIEGGGLEVFNFRTPAVLTTNKSLNTPRYASLPGIMKAKKKNIQVVPASSLDLPENGWEVESFLTPTEKPPVKLFTGTPQQQAQALVKALRDEAKVL